MTDRSGDSGMLELASWVVSALSEQGQTVAMAESLTGGLLTAAVVEVPGASMVLKGGVVAYDTLIKHDVLGVDDELLRQCGPVDPRVAAQLARGVRGLLGADWGVSATGVAGPGPHDGIPAGRAYIAVAGPGKAETVRKLSLEGGRAMVRAGCVRRALELLAFALGAPGGEEAAEQAGTTGR